MLYLYIHLATCVRANSGHVLGVAYINAHVLKYLKGLALEYHEP